MAVTLDLDDIQGIVARGFSRHRGARYLILSIQDAAAARKWLASVSLTSAAERGTAPVLNIAITAAGLVALGLDASVVAEFAPEFVAGMTDTTRSRILGDVGDNSPAGWRWGGPATPPVHLVAMLFATDDSTAHLGTGIPGCGPRERRAHGGDRARHFGHG